jgi:hypothetical protein
VFFGYIFYATLGSTSSHGSNVCFDYTALWPEMLNACGVKELGEVMSTKNPGEPARFAIERGSIESCLSGLCGRGYQIIEHLTAEEMERKSLSLRDGWLAGNVVGHFCFVNTSIAVSSDRRKEKLKVTLATDP